jgi:hypothetical protein
MKMSLSRYVVGGIAGVLLATGIFDGPLSLVSADQFVLPGVTQVDRSGKGDRLRLAPDAGTTIMIKRDDAPARAPVRDASDPRLAPTSLQDCEPLASPYADPRLGRFAGRCFV